MLKNHLEEKKLEGLLLKLKFRIPAPYIFACLGLLQAIIFYAVDQQILPTTIHAIHTDKIAIVYCMMVMLCYDDHKTVRLLFTSALACLAIFTPLSQYNQLGLDNIGYAHHDTMYSMLCLLYPILCSLNYYFHHYGVQLNNIGNHAYVAFWAPIVNLLTTLFYMVLALTTLFLCIFLTKVIGAGILWQELTDITLIKIYTPLLFATFCYVVYSHPNIALNILRGFAYLAHHLYWIVAPIGLMLVLSECFVIAQHGTIPDFNYRPMFLFTFISILLYQLSNYPDENYGKSYPVIEKIILYYNSLLPIIPIAYLIKFATDFTETNGDLACNATLLETGLSVGNFAPLLGGACLLYLSLVQAYYTHQSKEKQLLNLAKDSWPLCVVFSLACLIAYNPLFTIKPDYNHYLQHCHHFKESSETFATTTMGRYIA
jgi:hypothetical protein